MSDTKIIRTPAMLAEIEAYANLVDARHKEEVAGEVYKAIASSSNPYVRDTRSGAWKIYQDSHLATDTAMENHRVAMAFSRESVANDAIEAACTAEKLAEEGQENYW